MLFRASPWFDTLTSRESWQITVTQLLGGAYMELPTIATVVAILSDRRLSKQFSLVFSKVTAVLPDWTYFA